MSNTQTNELVQIVEQTGLEKQTSDNILSSFTPFLEQANEWKSKAEALVVTSEEQVKEMKEARIARLELKKIRVEANKIREQLKRDSILYGKAVQGAYSVIEFLIKPIEEHLEQQEKFVEIQEANRKEALKQLRTPEVEALQEFIPYGLDLGEMTEEDYSKLINGAKAQKKTKEDAEKKAEEERRAKEKAEREEQERIREENERLKAEAEERERLAKIEEEKRAKERAKEEARLAKEKADQDEALRKEREAKDKAQEELRAKEKAERKAKAEAEAKARKEAEDKAKAEQARLAAPDKVKLKELAVVINQIELPSLQTKGGESIIKNVRTLLNKTSNYVQEQADKL